MNLTIASKTTAVAISTIGAEPQSIVCDGIERLWGADPAVWGRHAPLLFPLIGRLREQRYFLNGHPIDAPMHGFCRDRAFEVVSQTNTSATLVTCADDETRKVFPFDFRLEVTFEVDGNTLAKTHRIANNSNIPMPFEIGGHEAYSTRLVDGDTMASYYVQFEDCSQLKYWGMDESGYLIEPKETLEALDGKLRNTPEQLNQDTLTFAQVPNGRVTLSNDNHNRGVTVELGDFPYLGIWTKAGVEDPAYLCIEPWSALPDGHFMSRELTEKPGVITVEPGETVELAYRMTFH